MSPHSLSPEMEACIKTCQYCATTCLRTAANHCLEMGGAHVEPAHYRTMLDCAEICQTSANFMLRNSTLHNTVCRACAAVCEACAKSCETVGDMPDCVVACYNCAESCLRMAATRSME